MTIRESAENYLETVLILSQRNGTVRAVDIAAELSFSKASVSVAMKHLRENGYLQTDADGFITLLPPGMAIAQRMYERHTAISDWLVSLGVGRKTAVEDACRIEHVISEESFEAMKQKVFGQSPKNSKTKASEADTAPEAVQNP